MRSRQRSLLAYQGPLLELLERAVTSGTGRGAALDQFTAGKTGTTESHRDAWFIGFTHDLVAGVWVGNDDNRPMHKVTGGKLPASIWREFVSEALRMPEFTGSQTIEIATVRADAPADDGYPFARESDGEALMDGQSSCNYDACGANYRSFRASDCTYQPYDGPRRMCSIATDPDLWQSVEAGDSVDDYPDADAAGCNYDACAMAYRSFDPYDCTYQPYDGERRLCRK